MDFVIAPKKMNITGGAINQPAGWVAHEYADMHQILDEVPFARGRLIGAHAGADQAARCQRSGLTGSRTRVPLASRSNCTAFAHQPAFAPPG